MMFLIKILVTFLFVIVSYLVMEKKSYDRLVDWLDASGMEKIHVQMNKITRNIESASRNDKAKEVWLYFGKRGFVVCDTGYSPLNFFKERLPLCFGCQNDAFIEICADTKAPKEIFFVYGHSLKVVYDQVTITFKSLEKDKNIQTIFCWCGQLK